MELNQIKKIVSKPKKKIIVFVKMCSVIIFLDEIGIVLVVDEI